MVETTAQMRAELLQIFARFDINKDALIDEREFQLILGALGQTLSEPAVAEHFERIDGNRDGAIQFEEFVEWWLDYRQGI